MIVQYDGRSDLLSDSALSVYGIKTLKIGDKIKVKLLRGEVQKTVTISHSAIDLIYDGA